MLFKSKKAKPSVLPENTSKVFEALTEEQGQLISNLKERRTVSVQVIQSLKQSAAISLRNIEQKKAQIKKEEAEYDALVTAIGVAEDKNSKVNQAIAVLEHLQK